MRDGKALQMGTSHELGQNFARVFDIGYLSSTGEQELCWTTSWGVSTRMIGGLIMAHGDDAGLRIPPRIAAVQAVVMVVRDDDDGSVADAAARLVTELGAAGVRVRLDADMSTGFGRRAVGWEIRGVPLRIELGPRDVAAGVATVVRRDESGKSEMPLTGLASQASALLDEIQASLLAQAMTLRDDHTVEVASVPEAIEAAATGFARMPWAELANGGEQALGEKAVTVRCLQRADATVPTSDDEPDLVAIVGRSY